jgi:hypothetical protein
MTDAFYDDHAAPEQWWTDDPHTVVAGYRAGYLSTITHLPRPDLNIRADDTMTVVTNPDGTEHILYTSITQGVQVTAQAPASDGDWLLHGWAVGVQEDPGMVLLALHVQATSPQPPTAQSSIPRPALRHPGPGYARRRRDGLHIANLIITFAYRVRATHSSAALLTRAPGLTIESAHGIYPFQVTGTWHDHPFYYRDKDGDISLSIGADPVASPLWEADMDCDDTSADTWATFETNFVFLAARLWPADPFSPTPLPPGLFAVTGPIRTPTGIRTHP